MNGPERIGIDPVAGFWTRDPHETDIEYIRADLAAPKVKALVWEGDGHWAHGPDEGWTEEANTPFGWGYSIEFGPDGNFMVGNTFGASKYGFNTPGEAKAAAQADYERRILEALE